MMRELFFFNDTATTEIYTLSLHDALPICPTPRGPRGGGRGGTTSRPGGRRRGGRPRRARSGRAAPLGRSRPRRRSAGRSEEHTSELQSRQYLVCRLLLEKKKPLSPLYQHN